MAGAATAVNRRIRRSPRRGIVLNSCRQDDGAASDLHRTRNSGRSEHNGQPLDAAWSPVINRLCEPRMNRVRHASEAVPRCDSLPVGLSCALCSLPFRPRSIVTLLFHRNSKQFLQNTYVSIRYVCLSLQLREIFGSNFTHVTFV